MSLASLFEWVLVLFAIVVAFVASSAIGTLVARLMVRSRPIRGSRRPSPPLSAHSDVSRVSSAAGKGAGSSPGSTPGRHPVQPR
jgi:hypothetical protein